MRIYPSTPRWEKGHGEMRKTLHILRHETTVRLVEGGNVPSLQPFFPFPFGAFGGAKEVLQSLSSWHVSYKAAMKAMNREGYARTRTWKL